MSNKHPLHRYVKQLKRLRQDLQQAVYMEMHEGMSGIAQSTYNGIFEAVKKKSDDPYFDSLVLAVPEGAKDKTVVAMVMLLAGQMLSYLEGEVVEHDDDD